jgi:hypothetical protein
MDLGHFETARGIEPTKIAARAGAPHADDVARRGPGGLGTTDIGGSATAMIIATGSKASVHPAEIPGNSPDPFLRSA